MTSYLTWMLCTLGVMALPALFLIMRVVNGRRAVGEVARNVGLQAVSESPRVWAGAIGGRLVRMGWVNVPEEQSVNSDFRGISALNNVARGIQGAADESPWRVLGIGGKAGGRTQSQLFIEVACKNPAYVNFERSGSSRSFEANLEALPGEAAVSLLGLRVGRLEVFEISETSVSFRMDDRHQIHVTSAWIRRWLDRCLEHAAKVDSVVGPPLKTMR